MRNTLAAGCIAMLASQASAQEPNTAEADFFADSPLVLTASRMAKPLLESPASVSIIDRQMIEASGARDIADLLRLAPGMVVGYHSGHSPAVTYHGLGAEFGRQLQVLIDGRSVFVPSFGGVPWSNLPLLIQDIERIEVIRGPNAVTYGANAFLATINIITRHAAEDLGAYYAVTSSDNANPDIEDVYLRVASQHEDLDWRLSVGTVADEGFAAINDSRRVAKANFRLDLLSDSNQFWTLQFGSSSSEAGRGFPPSPDTITDIERTEDATNSYVNLQWEGVWDSSTTIVRFTNTREEVTDNFDPGPFEVDLGAVTIPGITTFIDFDRDSDRTDLEVVHSDDVGDNLRLVYGAGARKDKVRSVFVLNDNSFDEVEVYRLFGAFEWRLNPDWLLDVGVMVEDTSLTSQETSPRVSLIRKIGSRHALRFVASAAKRNPILFEAEGNTAYDVNFPAPISATLTIPDRVGNEDIEPEDIESFEIGLRSQLNRAVETDIKLFSYEITDQIVFTDIDVDVDFGAPLGTVPFEVETVVNEADTDVIGVEFSLDYRPDDQISLHSGFSVVDVDSSENNFELSFPEHTAYFSARYRVDEKHEISGAFYYLDRIEWTDSSYNVPIARRLDLRYLYRMHHAFNVEVIGQNLYEDFEDYESDNVHDQVVYLRLSGGF